MSGHTPPHVRCASFLRFLYPRRGRQRIGQMDDMKTADVFIRFLDRGVRACEARSPGFSPAEAPIERDRAPIPADQLV